MRGVLLGAGLVAEHSESEHRRADRAVVGHDRGHQRRVRGQVIGVERADVNLGRSRLLEGGDLLGKPVGTASRQHHRCAGGQQLREFDADLAAATENHHRSAARVIHGCDYLPALVWEPMANATTRLTNDALAFLTERHLAMLTTLRSDNSPHVVAVGFTFDPKTHIARVITSGGSQKAVNAEQRGVAVLSQVDGARWLSLEGRATVNTDRRGGPGRRTALCAALPDAAGQSAAGRDRGPGRAGPRLVGTPRPQRRLGIRLPHAGALGST